MAGFEVKKLGRPPMYTKEERKARDKEGHKRRRLELQKWVNDLKISKGCSECGTHEGRLEWHHPEGAETKYNRISNIQTRKGLEAELPKVVVLCGVCHRKLELAKRERDLYGRFIKV